MDILWLWNLRSLCYSVVSSFASRYDTEITSVDVKKSKMPTTKCRFYEVSNVIFICVCSYYEEHTDSSFPSFSTCTTRIEINNLDLTKCSCFSIQFSVCTERYISHTRVSYFFPCPFTTGSLNLKLLRYFLKIVSFIGYFFLLLLYRCFLWQNYYYNFNFAEKYGK